MSSGCSWTGRNSLGDLQGLTVLWLGLSVLKEVTMVIFGISPLQCNVIINGGKMSVFRVNLYLK